ncbi:hypothetical protein JSO19_08055 [Leucobacter sp. UCMA 4100]|uniref:hypothetical protein n=1 Tax=Leucobacter sp. UCMA 4100 TaxID=2810534 RepID=UPI0022EAFA22|nr:hypothetical protein [Leucobacter sp. UCMA 4100]MDA3147333.1 hypothetical protein [Leucobacter sp. UCMA 4100]
MKILMSLALLVLPLSGSPLTSAEAAPLPKAPQEAVLASAAGVLATDPTLRAKPSQCIVWRITDVAKYRKYCL